jgi:hypothetical protein
MRSINLKFDFFRGSKNRAYIFYGLVLIIISVAVLSRLLFNGLVFTYDYGLYQPDGAHYYFRTLVFLGQDSISASNQVVDWYRINGFKNNIFDASIVRPENSQLWGLVSPRILYPFLSIPFVWLIGAPGMLVVPLISFLVLCVLTFRFARISNSYIFVLFVIFAVSISPTISRWMISNVTDSLVCALFAITAYIVSLKLEAGKEIAWLLLLVICSSITRFCLPIWLAIAFVWFLNKRRRDSLLLAAASSIMSIPVLLNAPDDALLPGTNPETFWEKASGLVISLIKVGFYEVAQLMALDRVLFVLLLLAITASIRNLKQVESQYFLLVLLSVWLIGAINGTVGVNFRYQMPVLGFMIWVLSVNFPKFRDWILWDRLNIVSSKTQD